MKNRRSNPIKAQIALTGGLVMLFAGCQVLTPTKADVNTEGTIGTTKTGTAGQKTPGATGGAATGTAQPFDSKVTGQVLDANGAPVANVQVNAFNGATATTGPDGKFSMDVVSQDDIVVDFSADGFLPRQLVTGVPKGGTAELTAILKPLDANVVKVDPAKGATLTSSDGNSVLEIPAGALATAGGVRVTWMNPMPSDTFSESYGELPGPLVTQSVDGPPLSIAPLGFSTVDFMDGATLKPGAQATLKMKVDPQALQMARNLNIPIDFNNPGTLQQPCYEYDRTTGRWVNPATSKLEQDAAGNVWFVYTMHGAEAPKNFTILQESVTQGGFKTGERTVKVPKTKTTYSVVIGGGGVKTFSSKSALNDYCRNNFCGEDWTNTDTYYVDKIEDIFGKYLNGSVHEKSANGQFDGDGIVGAHVSHAADWFGNTGKNTGGGGSFSIPVSHTRNSLGVSGATWRGASSSGGGFTMHINTDGNVHLNAVGGTVTVTAGGPAGSTIGGGGSFTGDQTRNASRDTVASVNAPASPAYLHGGQRSATVPVNGTADLGTIKVVHDATGQVIERVTGSPDNAQTPHNADGAGLAGATVTFNANDAITNGRTTASGAGGAFKFTYLNNQAFPGTVQADYKNYIQNTGPGAPYKIELRTDSSFSLTLGGTFNGDVVGQEATVVYKVDGVQYTKKVTLGADGKIDFTFCRDNTDDTLEFVLVSVDTPSMAASKPFPTATLTPGGAASGTVKLGYKGDVVKYHQ